ncbi:hypothetical protein HDV06_001903 [Boothiomyces sp. JEL0866]|nr:hypothetical protein HDV06_001903 [Boothiomyces sp. JEL0866]
MTRAGLKSRANLDSNIWRTIRQLKNLCFLKLDVNLRSLKGIEGLETLQELELTCEALDLTPIARLQHLRTLVLDKCCNLLNVEPIAFMSLEYLKIINCHGLTSLQDIRLMTTLKQLVINGSNRMWDISFLKYLVNLQLLDLKDSNNLLLIDGLGDYKCLEYLDISGSVVRAVGNIPDSVKILQMERCDNLYSFKCISSVVELNLRKCIGMQSLDLGLASDLRILNCNGSYSISSILGIQLALNLHSADLSGTAITDLDLIGLNNLSILKIKDCKLLTGFQLPSNLEYLDMDGCVSVISFDTISTTKLKILSISNTLITNIDFIRNMTIKKLVARSCVKLIHADLYDLALEFVNFSICYNLKSMDGFRNVKCLDVTHCPVKPHLEQPNL